MPITAHRPEQRLVDLVGALRGTWHGNIAMCRCPAHADTTPSLSLRQGDKGILVTCFAGCDAVDVLRELDRIVLTGHYRGQYIERAQIYAKRRQARFGRAKHLFVVHLRWRQGYAIVLPSDDF